MSSNGGIDKTQDGDEHPLITSSKGKITAKAKVRFVGTEYKKISKEIDTMLPLMANVKKNTNY